MKRFISILLAVIIAAVAGTASAQSSANIIKQKARELPGANNPPPPARPVAQPVTISPAPAPAIPAPPTAVALNITDAQKPDVDKVAASLGAIKPGTPVTTEQTDALEKELTALAKGTTKPGKESVAKLAKDLSAALAGPNVTAHTQGQLARLLHFSLNSRELPTAQSQSLVLGAQNSLKASGVGETEMKAVTADLTAIVAEVQKGRPKLYQ